MCGKRIMKGRTVSSLRSAVRHIFLKRVKFTGVSKKLIGWLVAAKWGKQTVGRKKVWIDGREEGKVWLKNPLFIYTWDPVVGCKLCLLCPLRLHCKLRLHCALRVHCKQRQHCKHCKHCQHCILCMSCLFCMVCMVCIPSLFYMIYSGVFQQSGCILAEVLINFRRYFVLWYKHCYRAATSELQWSICHRRRELIRLLKCGVWN